MLFGFSLFLQFNQTGHGSLCSQAIMLVTDGATEMYDDVFEKYNWPERKVSTLLLFSSLFCPSQSWMFNVLCVLFHNNVLLLHVSIDVYFNTPVFTFYSFFISLPPITLKCTDHANMMFSALRHYSTIFSLRRKKTWKTITNFKRRLCAAQSQRLCSSSS